MTELPYHLARPWALVLLAAVPLAVAALLLERRRAPRLRHPRAELLARSGRGWAARLWWFPQALLILALGLVVLALARPRSVEREAEREAVEGIDIVIAFDISTSMLALDFQPKDRITVARAVLEDFIRRRRTDRIGLVVFARDAYTQCPLTLDHGILASVVEGLRPGSIDDGTAIGNALATAVNRLRDSSASSKTIVLITDGANNAGQIGPVEAAHLAQAFGIKVFPILVGKGGLVPVPGGSFLEPRYADIPVDPELLQLIARITGGVYANATDRATLEQGLQNVLDRLTKTRLVEAGGRSREKELFAALLRPAFWLALAALFLGATRWRAFP